MSVIPQKVLIAALVIGLDQGIKEIADHFGLIVINQGSAFSFSVPNSVSMVAMTVLLVFMATAGLTMRLDLHSKLVLLAMYMAGGSNLYDRAIYGGVQDVVWGPLLINFADIVLITGGIYVLFHLFKARNIKTPDESGV